MRRAGHLQHAFHADLAMAGNGADVGELAGLRHLEAHGLGSGTGPEFFRRDLQIGNRDIVFGALAAGDGNLDGIADISVQHGIDLALRIQVHHLSVGHAGLQHIALHCAFLGGGCDRRRFDGRIGGLGVRHTGTVMNTAAMTAARVRGRQCSMVVAFIFFHSRHQFQARHWQPLFIFPSIECLRNFHLVLRQPGIGFLISLCRLHFLRVTVSDP